MDQGREGAGGGGELSNDGGESALPLWLVAAPVLLQNGEEKVKIERPGGAPVWSLSWNPSK